MTGSPTPTASMPAGRCAAPYFDDIDRLIDAALRGNLVHDPLAAFIKAFPHGPFSECGG